MCSPETMLLQKQMCKCAKDKHEHTHTAGKEPYLSFTTHRTVGRKAWIRLVQPHVEDGAFAVMLLAERVRDPRLRHQVGQRLLPEGETLRPVLAHQHPAKHVSV